MPTNKEPCHGQFDSLMSWSVPLNLPATYRYLWNLRLTAFHMLWHFKTKGLLKTLALTLSKVLKFVGVEKNNKPNCIGEKGQSLYGQILNLKPGELVEVKSEEEILVTLDENRKSRGLLWMAGMRKFCGKRYRVYKRLERILLESTGEFRMVSNTVLLEGVMCDGKEFYGCDRSCFHFWREAWLKRVQE